MSPRRDLSHKSARLGQSSTRDTVAMRFDAAPLVRLVDRYSGYFRQGTVYRALSRANVQAAEALQQGMVDELKRRIEATGRPQRGGQRLENSILNERNREVFANTFSVGIARWMDVSPAALYYRQIEEGAASFGAYILFSNNAEDGGYGRVGGGPYSSPGAGRQLRMPQFSRSGGKVHGVWVPDIGPFPAYRYSRGASKAFRRISMFDLYREQLAIVGIKITKENQGDYFK